MADHVMARGYGRAAYYAELPGSNDALVLVLLQLSGLQSNSALQDHTSLASLLRSTNRECTATNWQRPVVASGTSAIYSSTSKRVDCFFPAQTVTSLGARNAQQTVQKLLVCYWPDVGAGGDAAIQPLTMHDYYAELYGGDFQMRLDSGFYRDGS